MKVTVQQSHSIISYFGNNADWHYLHDNFDLEKIAKKIEKNIHYVGTLFVKFVLTHDFKIENALTKQKKLGLFLDEKNIQLTHKITRLLAENLEWSIIDFKKYQLQERIIRNPLGAGRGFTDFLASVMANQELDLVDY